MNKVFKRWPSHRTNTIDQHLLAEIRDQIEALPLASTLSYMKVEEAKALRRELQDLHGRLEHQAAVIKLLQRAAGIDIEKLNEEELALLADVGALVS